MTEPDGNQPNTVTFTWKQNLIFWIVFFGLGTFTLVKCSEEPGVSDAQRRRFDACVAEKQNLGVDAIKAVDICSYWKRANP